LLVGNDVVDLRDPENQPEAIHPRFDDRVFTWAERARILAAGSPHRMRWVLWAAKESA
jgi:phosphopantetheinyl transferase (holo-ACP synthase)